MHTKMLNRRREKAMRKPKIFDPKKIAALIIITLFTMGFIGGIPTKTAHAEASTAKLRVVPSLIKDLEPGEEFSVNITIEDVENLYGIEIEFTWNPSIIEYVSHEVKIPVESYPEGVLHEPVLEVKDEVDAAAGDYAMAYSSYQPAEPFNGSGIIFTMTFRVVGYGTTLLSFASVKLAGYGTPPPPIPYETYDGQFTNFVPPPAKIYVAPQKIVDPTLIPCKNFTIDIKIDDAYNLANFEFWLSYNTSLLDSTLINVPAPFTPTITQIIDEEGKVHVAGSTEPVNGNFTLASITFHVTNLGESILNLYNITLTDNLGQPIEYEPPIDGYFNNILLAKIFVYPEELIDPTLSIGSTFSIEIKMQDAIDFYSYQYTLSYDSNILTYIGSMIIPPSEEVNYTPEVQVDNFAGWILINVTYYPPAEPQTVTEPQTIAQIFFQVKNYGSTVLDLHNITIKDIDGKEIPHLEDGSEDGFFATLTADIAVISIELSPNAVYEGKQVEVTVTVANLGDITSTFNVTLYIEENKTGEKQAIQLNPGENTTLNFTLNTSGLQPCFNYTVTARASQVLYEVNIENNELSTSLKIKMLGDITGDGVIDIYDVTAACQAYGSRIGDPNWNEEADLSPEWGIIDIYDIVTLCAYYGRQCSS